MENKYCIITPEMKTLITTDILSTKDIEVINDGVNRYDTFDYKGMTFKKYCYCGELVAVIGYNNYTSMSRAYEEIIDYLMEHYL